MSDTFAVAKCPKLRKVSEQNSLKQNLLEQNPLVQKLFWQNPFEQKMLGQNPFEQKMLGQNPLEQRMPKYLRKFFGYPLGDMIDYPPPWVVVLLLENGLYGLLSIEICSLFTMILSMISKKNNNITFYIKLTYWLSYLKSRDSSLEIVF